MKFMNSDYGYADFARGKSTRRSGTAGASPRNSTDPNVTKSSGGTAPSKPAAKNSGKRMGAYNNSGDVVKPVKAVPDATTSSGQRINRNRGANASSALSPTYGPQPMFGPQQKKGKLGNLKDAVEGKAQYYGAKGKNALAKVGRFAMKNKVGTGLAAAGALGAVGLGIAGVRKMRADKGKKRGSYSR
jgi:hypothetical protein